MAHSEVNEAESHPEQNTLFILLQMSQYLAIQTQLWMNGKMRHIADIWYVMLPDLLKIKDAVLGTTSLSSPLI